MDSTMDLLSNTWTDGSPTAFIPSPLADPFLFPPTLPSQTEQAATGYTYSIYDTETAFNSETACSNNSAPQYYLSDEKPQQNPLVDTAFQDGSLDTAFQDGSFADDWLTTPLDLFDLTTSSSCNNINGTTVEQKFSQQQIDIQSSFYSHLTVGPVQPNNSTPAQLPTNDQRLTPPVFTPLKSVKEIRAEIEREGAAILASSPVASPGPVPSAVTTQTAAEPVVECEGEFDCPPPQQQSVQYMQCISIQPGTVVQLQLSNGANATLQDDGQGRLIVVASPAELRLQQHDTNMSGYSSSASSTCDFKMRPPSRRRTTAGNQGPTPLRPKYGCSEKISDRKRVQNREAAIRYRMKKQEEKMQRQSEIEFEELRQVKLKSQVDELERQVTSLRGMLLEVGV